MRKIENTRENKLSLTCVFLCIYFIFLPFDFIRIGSIGSVTRILAILPIFFSILSIGKKLIIKKEPIVFWLLFFLLSSAVSYVYSIQADYSLDAIKTLLLNVVMIFVVGACQIYNDREIQYMIYALIAGSWLSVIMVLLFGTSQYGRMTILFGNAQQDQNYLCGFMLFAFVYHFILFLRSRKILQLILSLFIILAVVLTGSRGALVAYIATIVSCMLSLGTEKKHRMRTVVLGIFGVIAIGFVIYQFIMPNLDSMLYNRYTIEYLLKRGTTGRMDIWKYLLDKYRESSLFRQFFGYGYGTTVIVNDMYGVMGGKVAHNLYIDNLITLGIPGLIAAIGLHVSCIKTGIRKKAPFFTSIMAGYIVMCFSMSLTSYKPIWATIIMLIIIQAGMNTETQSFSYGNQPNSRVIDDFRV